MTAFHLGYGTNGFANHRLDDALRVIADLGYTSVALTLDHHHLDPFAGDVVEQTEHVAGLLDRLGLRCVVETGARYLLDPYRKHHPTLVCDEPARRVDFLNRAVRIAADLGADCVSFWSGIRPSTVDSRVAWRRLRDGVSAVLDEADAFQVRLGLEPEPGMFVERLSDALRLREELGAPPLLGITLDVGHCVAVEPDDAAACLRRAAGLLVNVQLDDMRTGVHEHLEFGEGELDLPATLAALTEVGYAGVAAVELPRHSHAAPDVAATALSALRAALRNESSALGQERGNKGAGLGAVFGGESGALRAEQGNEGADGGAVFGGESSALRAEQADEGAGGGAVLGDESSALGHVREDKGADSGAALGSESGALGQERGDEGADVGAVLGSESGALGAVLRTEGG